MKEISTGKWCAMLSLPPLLFLFLFFNLSWFSTEICLKDWLRKIVVEVGITPKLPDHNVFNSCHSFINHWFWSCFSCTLCHETPCQSQILKDTLTTFVHCLHWLLTVGSVFSFNRTWQIINLWLWFLCLHLRAWYLAFCPGAHLLCSALSVCFCQGYICQFCQLSYLLARRKSYCYWASLHSL